MAIVRSTFHETTSDTLDILTNFQPHFPPSTFSYSKRRASEATLKIHTPSPRDHISFPHDHISFPHDHISFPHDHISFTNMTQYGGVLFHLRGNKNQ